MQGSLTQLHDGPFQEGSFQGGGRALWGCLGPWGCPGFVLAGALGMSWGREPQDNPRTFLGTPQEFPQNKRTPGHPQGTPRAPPSLTEGFFKGALHKGSSRKDSLRPFVRIPYARVRHIRVPHKDPLRKGSLRKGPLQEDSLRVGPLRKDPLRKESFHNGSLHKGSVPGGCCVSWGCLGDALGLPRRAPWGCPGAGHIYIRTHTRTDHASRFTYVRNRYTRVRYIRVPYTRFRYTRIPYVRLPYKRVRYTRVPYARNRYRRLRY